MQLTNRAREWARHVSGTWWNWGAAARYRRELRQAVPPATADEQGREIALLVSTYQRPRHLQLCLASIARQHGVSGRVELVVTDDGSQDETAEVVERFARTVDFPVAFTTHPHETFQLARCRNEGVRASTAPYLLFLDGDCVLPPDHVAAHLEFRRLGQVAAGDCCRLEETVSKGITEQTIRGACFASWGSGSERRRLADRHRRIGLYNALRHPTKPMLVGNNVGVWRHDYERVNGYDENFQGWGCEDDDLGYRLRAAGLAIASILARTTTYHVWHPTDVTAPRIWREGSNVAYLKREQRSIRCAKGLQEGGSPVAVRGGGERGQTQVLRWNGSGRGESEPPRRQAV